MYQIAQFPNVTKANKWLEANPDIEIIELKYFEQFGGTWISILYKPFKVDKRNYGGHYEAN